MHVLPTNVLYRFRMNRATATSERAVAQGEGQEREGESAIAQGEGQERERAL